MSPNAPAQSKTQSNSIAIGLSLLTLLFAFGIALAGSLLHEKAILVAVGLVALIGGLAMFRWPDLATLAVVGAVYTNAPVVAVKFHGAPEFLPAAVLALLAWPFFFRIVIRGEKVRFSPVLIFLFLLMIVQFVGAMIAREPLTSFRDFLSFLFEGALLFFLMTNLVRTTKVATGVFCVLALSAIIMGGIPMARQLSGNFESNFGGFGQVDSQFETAEGDDQVPIQQQRAAGSIGEQNRYAQFMILLVPITVALFAIAKSTPLKVFALAATLFAFLGFALAFSRGAAVGLGITLAIAIALRLVSRNQLKLVALGIVLVCLMLPQYLTRLASLGDVAGALGGGSAGLNNVDGAIRGRVTEMVAALLIYRDHPLVGVGPGMFGKYSQEYGQRIGLRSLDQGRQAHSMLLDVAAENGTLGLIAVLGLLLMLVRNLLYARNAAMERLRVGALSDAAGQAGSQASDSIKLHLATGILVAVLIYLSTGLFLHISYIRYLWLLLALADAIAFLVVSDQEDGDYLPQFVFSKSS